MRIIAFLVLVCVATSTFSAELNVGGDFRGDLERYLTETAAKAWSARAAKVATLKSPAQVRERQEFIRTWIEKSAGGFPAKTPLNARTTGTLERDGYRVEKIVFESMPQFYVTANLYVPTRGVAPFPAVIGVAGHSDTGKAIGTYQYAWIGFAKRGFVVLAFDPPGQGERLEYVDPSTGKSTVGVGVPEHNMAGLQCLLTGSTFARYEMWDGIRAFDYLLTRREVDPKRIGVAGNSGGGTQAAYLAAVEPRLAAAVSSCYITSWQTLWSGPGPQDAEQIFPNFLSDGVDFGDFLIAFAPKPIEMTTAVRDFFPIAGARATFAEVEKVFAAADAPGRAGYFEYDDPHGWSKPRREAAYRWFAKWLQSKEDDGAEPPIEVERPDILNVTSTGLVATSLRGATVQSLNAQRAQELFAKRAALRSTPDNLRKMIRARLGLERGGGTHSIETIDTIQADGYHIEKLKLNIEPALTVPALLFVPNSSGRKPAVIWMDSAGKAAQLARIEQAVRAGEVVLAVDPRATGEGAVATTGRGYTQEYQMAMRALLVGKTLIGMQVADALRAFDYLRSRSEVDPSRVRMYGRGNLGLTALLGAALEPAVTEVAADRAPLSWMSIVRAPIHSGVTAVIVPGVLNDFDVPDLAACIAPRKLTITHPVTATGVAVSGNDASREYARARSIYRKSPSAFQLEMN